MEVEQAAPITTAVNYAWGVEQTRSFWKHKLFSFLMLIVAGLTLLAALLLVSASQLVGASWFAGVVARFPLLMVLGAWTVRYATTLLFIFVVGLVYYFVPNAKVRFRDVWIGAVVTGLLWKGGLDAFSWYTFWIHETGILARALMIASLNIGTSSGLRDVMRLPSSTTGLST